MGGGHMPPRTFEGGYRVEAVLHTPLYAIYTILIQKPVFQIVFMVVAK